MSKFLPTSGRMPPGRWCGHEAGCNSEIHRKNTICMFFLPVGKSPADESKCSGKTKKSRDVVMASR